MAIPRIRASCALAGFLLALFCAGCQTTDPPPAETVLWLKLNDSLSQYDSVVVQLLDHDSQAILKVLWNTRLTAPAKDIPSYPLKTLAGKPFIIRVRGYKAVGQLGVETLIYYENGQKRVDHSSLPPITPVNALAKLKPSSGTLAPAFNKDSLNYKVTVPLGVNAVTFALQAENPAALITFGGDTVAAGGTTKARTVGTSPDTVSISVTDYSTGAPVARTYTVAIFPTPPPGLYLATLRPTYGTLFPDWDPETTQIYTLKLPNNVDTVAFFVSPADTRTMTVDFNGKALFPGAKSELFHVPAGVAFPIPIIVHRGDESSFYQVTIDRSTQ